MSFTTTHLGTNIVLLDHATANGSSASFEYLHGTKTMNLYVYGSLGGGTIKLEVLVPGTAIYVALNGLTITDKGMYTINTNAFTGRVTLTNATAASVTVVVQGSVAEAL